MDAFIYFDERLPVGLDSLEDALDSALTGFGEVTGTGTGQLGSNIDVFVDDGSYSKHELVQVIRHALSEFELPKSSRVVVDGENFLLSAN
jgi:hypothetical protein